MPKKLYIPPKEEIVELYINQNYTLTQLRQHYNIGETALLSWLKKYGIKKPPKPQIILQKEDIVRMYHNEKKTFREICQFYHIGAATLEGWFERHGIEKRNVYEARQLASQRNLDHNGRINPTQNHWTGETYRILNDKKALKEFVDNQGDKGTSAVAQALGCSISVLLRRVHKFGLYDRLNHFTSRQESEIRELFTSWGIEFRADRQVIAPLEIDIYIPDLKFGVEFNGDYWHNDDHVQPWHHRYKSNQAAKKGVFIYHIFEYEWEDSRKKPIIISQLRNLCGKNENRVYARRCEIREVPFQESKTFLNENHLQGADLHSVALGLYYKDKLFSIMTFCVPRFNKKYDWELSRFCNKTDTSVIGGANKLFSYFVKHYLKESETILSYSNIAKTRGIVYGKLGFTLSHISDPNYVWVNDYDDIKTRYQCQMKDEDETMREKGYHKIYDCGNKVWAFNPRGVNNEENQ